MMQKGYENRYQVEMISIEDLVPQEHLLRQISEAVDFSKIYEFVEELYCDDNGRPSIDPVVLFKMVLIQHLYGLPSLRRTADEVSLNIAYPSTLPNSSPKIRVFNAVQPENILFILVTLLVSNLLTSKLVKLLQ